LYSAIDGPERTEQASVTQETKYAIDISVETQYLSDESSPGDNVYSFAYTVTITNRGNIATQLISRHWFIEDDAGTLKEVRGLGVVGQQPLLKPGESFQYTSGSQLPTPVGRMHGSYFFVAEDGERFDAEVPAFNLLMPRVLH
jgi:ApaG protein